MTVPGSEGPTLNDGTALPTDLSHPSLHSWIRINLDDKETDVRTQIQRVIQDVPYPWRSVESIPPSVETIVMDVLQQELDDVSCPDEYRTACLKCLRALSKAKNILPSSFFSQNVTREGANPICGGGYADIWKGHLRDTQVCLKVLRIFATEEARTKILRDLCHEALMWRQLRHPNILPFLGVSKDLFAPSYCMISPWMVNGNIMSYLEAHPDHDRLTLLIQVAEGMKYLHNHDPPIVHADIRGANILVTDDLCCCLADFGLSLFAESQAFDSSPRMTRGSLRWLAPEYIDFTPFDKSYLTARDIYAYGCTVIEVFTGKPPFSDIKNDARVIHKVMNGSRPPRPPANVFPNDRLWSLVTACLMTVPCGRPNTENILIVLSLVNTGFCELESPAAVVEVCGLESLPDAAIESLQHTYPVYSSRTSPMIPDTAVDSRKLPPLNTSPHGYPSASSTMHGGSHIRSPTASYPAAYNNYPTNASGSYRYAMSMADLSNIPMSSHSHTAMTDVRSSSPYGRNLSHVPPPSYTPPPVSPTSADDSPTIKKKRKRADAAQLKILNETYARTAFPSTEERLALAKLLDMSTRSVQIWYSCCFRYDHHLFTYQPSNFTGSKIKDSR
ncbi:kinase-like domain-containing protein [Desarmillaria tabescens]|uniref:Kinase-like domain-containing protein n=1 Tax=Armillaria tabescens TaxID=1929756 RepID=A0AA39J8C7_ARMTA|nr:kinase-like domain-containing protein [Desarmillaria tabescens]KAK0437918.1 kinase-like domain-containing protein [Desarmillaria tabescens]